MKWFIIFPSHVVTVGGYAFFQQDAVVDCAVAKSIDIWFLKGLTDDQVWLGGKLLGVIESLQC